MSEAKNVSEPKIEERSKKSGNYSSMAGFLMMAVGYAVGAGAIWRFPYMIGMNGGGAFMLVLLVMSFIVGIPLILGELTIGRATQSSAIAAYHKLEGKSGKKSLWKLAGWMGVAGGFGLMTYYGSITGTALYYVVQSAVKGFRGVTSEGTTEVYNNLIGSAPMMTLYTAIVLALVAFILFKGVKNGFERLAKIALPVLAICIIICSVYAMVTLPQAGAAAKWLFTPDWSKVTGKTLLDCLSQVLFVAGLGMSAVYAFGSNLGEESSLMQTSMVMTVGNLILAILAGLAIFPAVFSFGLDPESGSSLVFITLPMLFGKMVAGRLLATCFFLCFFLAAFMTSVGIVEGIAAAISDVFGIKKKKMLVIVVAALTVCSIIPTLAQTPILSDVRIAGMDLYTLIDFIVCSIIIPIGVLMTIVYCGYRFAFKNYIKEANQGAKYLKMGTGPVWKFIVKILCPVCIVVVMIMGITSAFS